MGDFSHLSKDGKASMVDVTAKEASYRLARAQGQVVVSQKCIASLNEDAIREVTHTARLAAIQGAKQTSSLVPLCHQVPLSHVSIHVELDLDAQAFTVTATCKTNSQTGVEMEALSAVSVACLTIYDMIKAVDPAAILGPFKVMEKRGGKAGVWHRGIGKTNE